jgi:hypothetical protein
MMYKLDFEMFNKLKIKTLILVQKFKEKLRILCSFKNDSKIIYLIMTLFQNSADTLELMYPPLNSISRADSCYFNMIQKEVEWGGQSRHQIKEENEKETSESALSPYSNSLSQGDREYFNIVKTEDGLSKSIKVKLAQNNDRTEAKEYNLKLSKPESATIPHFLHHKIYSDDSRPALGLYLGK